MDRRSIFLTLALLLTTCCAERPRLTNVILISLDTVRADHLSVYGYHRPTTPNLARLARESVVFEQAFTPTPWTVPAHMSLFTSLYPSVHSISHLTPQSDMSKMLPEMLEDAGFQTAAFVAPVLSEDYGFSKGYNHYFRPERVRAAGIMVDHALEWLAQDPGRPVVREQPVFLFLHLFDVHHPYEPPWPFDTAYVPAYRPNIRDISRSHPYEQDKELSTEELSEVVALYDGEIAYADFEIGRFLDELAALDLYDSSLIVVFGDHGEGFLEHGLMNHGNSVYDELIRIPLLIRFPRARHAGRRVEEPVQLIDVTPTILREVGVEPLPVMQGSLLLDTLPATDSRRSAYASEAFAACLRTSSWKLIENPPSRFEKIPRAIRAEYELYDLKKDPKEQNNLAAALPDRVQSMARTLGVIAKDNRALRMRMRKALKVRELELTEDQVRELKALGYIQ